MIQIHGYASRFDKHCRQYERAPTVPHIATKLTIQLKIDATMQPFMFLKGL
jgi:hypothetical protein